ncbi:MAG: YebC/PmpR family DNA-binding regulatory protein [Candidatus Krumholzibacteriia bacterium]|jgi:YebC/PmpR family DNA-binding regulatory protein
MAGHSKWANIKHRKGAQDAKRAKVFTRLIREITVAARQGGSDPDANPRLRSAIIAGRSSNMPNDTIEKATKRGTGELGDLIIEEINYEGYGPGGVAVLVECQTDNKNRTTAEVRHAFTKYNGNLGSNGCVSYLFERKGMIVLDGEKTDMEKVMDAAIEAGAEDVEDDSGVISVTTAMEELHSVSAALSDADFPVMSTDLVQVPSTTIQVEGKDALTLMKLVTRLDDLDDVSQVSANFDIDDDVMAEIEDQL